MKPGLSKKKSPKQIASFVSTDVKTGVNIPGSRHHSLTISSMKRPASENVIVGMTAGENPTKQINPLQESIKADFQSKLSGAIQEALINTITRADVPESLAGVRELAQAHQWREVCSLSEDLLSGKNLLDPATGASAGTLAPHERIELSFAFAFACRKLRKFKTAVDHLATLGDFDSPEYRFETFPDLYPNKSGSFVPFSLQVLRALMPRFVGHLDKAVEQLYLLLDAVRKTPIPDPSSSQPEPEPAVDSTMSTIIDPLLNRANPRPQPNRRRLTPREERLYREQMLAYVLIDIHISIKQYDAVVALMRQLIAVNPTNPELLQQLGRLCIQIGRTSLALELFSRCNELLRTDSQAGISLEEHMNRGFVFVANMQFSQALDEFEAVCTFDPTNAHAANNKAICLLHLGRLAEATVTLEELVFACPQVVSSESIVQNMCALYDLQDENVAVKKQVLVELIKAVAPDCFDFSSLRLPQN